MVPRSQENSSSGPVSSPFVIVVGDCDTKLWGLTPSERHARAFARAGAGDVLPSLREVPNGGAIALVRADYVLAEDLVRKLVGTPGTILVVDGNTERDGVAVAAHVEPEQAAEVAELLANGSFDPGSPALQGLRVLGPTDLGSTYNEALRKREAPYVASLTERPLAEIEKESFAAVYKGATDFVTKWCWPVPARWVTRWAAERHISPNSITTVSLIMVLLATYLFAEGHFLLGVATAWFMTFLDTVDGKLARVTMTSTKWGNIYDHGVDLIHPPFWWAAWWYGVKGSADPALIPTLEMSLWVIIVGYVVGRLFEGIFTRSFKIQPHIWRPVDSFFRTITARRNPNLAILMIGALFMRPDLGFIAVAVWTVVSLIFHAVRICQAFSMRLRGEEVRSWLKEAG